MYDRRLLGSWRSDRRKTAREITSRKDIPPNQRLLSIFGKLELRYTRARCYSTLDGHTEVGHYRVVAKNSSSVVTVGTSSLTGEEAIYHIHFEGNYYWISLGKFREYFRRVKGPSNAHTQPKRAARKTQRSRTRRQRARG
jgi:hypothetical protein